MVYYIYVNIGPSYDPNICPQHAEFGTFENNVVHSVGWYGLWVFEKYFPKVGGCCDCDVDTPAVFKTLVTWNSLRGGLFNNRHRQIESQFRVKVTHLSLFYSYLR